MTYTVLIVEDDELLALAVRARLEAIGCRVIHVPTGPAGIAAAVKHHPNVVVLDIRLPGEDGFKVCSEIRKAPGLENTGIVFLSANSTTPYRDRAFQSGADMFLAKPCESAELLSAVRALAERAVAPRPLSTRIEV